MNPMIFNMGREQVRRKPIARMFPALMNGDGCTESNWVMRAESMPDSNLSVGNKVFGTFAERNAKPERKSCDDIKKLPVALAGQKLADNARPVINCVADDVGGKTSASDARRGHGVQPEFKVGDLVECLPFDGCRQDRKDYCLGKTFAIESIKPSSNFSDVDSPIALFVGNNWGWPLRALRHAETEPQEKDGWIWDKYVGYWKNGDMWCGGNQRCGFWLAKRHSPYLHRDMAWKSTADWWPKWIELKCAMEKAK